jgi:hypothetical protein
MNFYHKYLKYKKKYLLLKGGNNIKYTSIPNSNYDGISALAHSNTNHYNNKYNRNMEGGALVRIHDSWCWQ